jgi:hypothetical protein
MRRKLLSDVLHVARAGLALLACLGATSTARADEPWLAVHLAGGQTANYPVSQVDRVRFEGDTLVVEWTSGIERWRVNAITKIEFLWDPANSSTPQSAAAVVKVMHLFQNQPNPFFPETRIAFELPRAGSVELRVYGADGRLIRTLLKEQRPAGRHTVSWDGRDDAGGTVAGGVYFYELKASEVEESRRMILLP